MAVGLNKTFLVLSLPIISIVSLYLYCRRQSKPSANSDQLRDDLLKIQPETKRSEDKQSNEYDQSTSETPANSTNMQLIANQSTDTKMAADKSLPNKDQRSVKTQRSSSNGTTNNSDKQSKRSNESSVQSVENNLNKLSLKANDNKSNDSSKTLTFAQVLEKKNLVKQQVANDNLKSTSGSASTLDNKVTNNKAVSRESNNDSRKHENKAKTDKVNENGIRNKHSNFNGKSKKNEKSEQNLNNDRSNSLKNNSENVANKASESRRVPEASSSHKSISCATESIVNNHNRVDNDSKETAIVDNNWNNKPLARPPTKQPLIDTPPQISLASSSACQATSAGDSADLMLNNKSDLKRLNDSHPQQSPYSDVYSEV